jgi:peptidyl-prolyl cis-trans isomerase SurA
MPKSLRRTLSTLLAAALCAITLPATPTVAQDVLDGLAAVVNDEPITFSQVRELVLPREQGLRQFLRGKDLEEKIKELRLSAINELIDQSLLLQEYKKRGMQIPPYVVDDRIATIIRSDFNGDRSAFLRTLAAQGLTIEKFRKQEFNKIIVGALRNSAVKSNFIGTETEITEYFRSHPEEFVVEEQLHLRMIVLTPPTPGEDGKTPPDRRKELLEGLRAEVKAGKSFGELARQHSTDDSKEKDGDWGWITPKTLNEDLTKAAFKLKKGQTSAPIALGDRFYLLYAQDTKPRGTMKLDDELREKIRQKLSEAERAEQQRVFMERLRKKAHIQIF